MKQSIITILILNCIMAPIGCKDHADTESDMQKYLGDTQALVREGKHKEALDRFVWFHDHALEHRPAMYGVRLSFAMTYWKQLGDVYPPAITAMKKIRDDKTALIAKGKGDRSLFHDVTALNRTLEEDGKTVDLFRKLDQEQHDMAKQCWSIAKGVIIKAKAYDLAGMYIGIGDLVGEFGKVKATFDRTKAMYEDENIGEHLKSFNENNFVNETLLLIDVALALKDVEAAKEIQSEALMILDDDRLRESTR